MPEYTIELPRLHPEQARVKGTRARFNVVNCGRRWGKTKLGEDLAVGPALEGRPVAWGAPNYKYLQEPWDDLRRLLAPVTSRCNSTERRIELITGGRIDFWTFDGGDPGRSYKYARWIVDEAAMVAGLMQTWTEAVRPTLTDYRGDAFFLSTPKGLNDFYTLYGYGESGRDGWASFTMPTSSNPRIPGLDQEIAEARADLPENAFRQEYLAEFLEEGAGVFRKVRDAVDPGRVDNEDRRPDVFYQIGMDVAKHEDFTVVTVVDQDGRQVYFDRVNQISWNRVMDVAESVASHFKARVVLDTTGVGDAIYDQLAARGVAVVPYRFNNASKESLIDNLAIMLEHGRMRLMDHPVQTSELLAFAYERLPSGRYRMSAPLGQHDDCVIALALAAHGMDRSPVSVGTRDVPTVKPLVPEDEDRERFEANRRAIEAERGQTRNGRVKVGKTV